jgi:hypothetical protein
MGSHQTKENDQFKRMREDEEPKKEKVEFYSPQIQGFVNTVMTLSQNSLGIYHHRGGSTSLYSIKPKSHMIVAHLSLWCTSNQPWFHFDDLTNLRLVIPNYLEAITVASEYVTSNSLYKNRKRINQEIIPLFSLHPELLAKIQQNFNAKLLIKTKEMSFKKQAISHVPHVP